MEPAPPPIPEPLPAEAKPPVTSLGAKLLNVFAAPSDVFEEVKAGAASAANWLVPTLLLSLVGVISSIIIFSQPAVLQQVREEQSKALDQQVEAGKLTRQQADKALEFMGPTMFKVSGCVGSFVVSFVRVLWWGLIVWLFGKWFLGAHFRFAKALEASGLTLMISALGALITLLLTVILDRLFASPSLALAVGDFDIKRKSHIFLALVNPFYFWQVGILSAGLARLSGVPFVRAAVPLFVWWLAQESLLIMAGLGQLVLG